MAGARRTARRRLDPIVARPTAAARYRPRRGALTIGALTVGALTVGALTIGARTCRGGGRRRAWPLGRGIGWRRAAAWARLAGNAGLLRRSAWG
jgi:hypothetical protein